MAGKTTGRSKSKSKKTQRPRLRIALTGANNPVISRLASRLDQDPNVESVVLFDVIRPVGKMERARFVNVDLTLPEAPTILSEVMREEKVTTFVHGSFLANPARDPVWAHELETIGSMHALDACAAAKVKHVILKSTTMVYGAHHDNPAFLTETHPLRGNRGSRWVRDKLEADLQFQRFGTENPNTVVTVARLATVLAPSVTHYVARYLARPVVPVMAGYDPLMQFLDLEDAARALLKIIEKRPKGVFNIAPRDVLPLSSVLRIGRRIPIPISHPLVYSLGGILWRGQMVDVPPRFLHYFRYAWNVDAELAKSQFGLSALWTTRDVVTRFYEGDTRSEDAHTEFEEDKR